MSVHFHLLQHWRLNSPVRERLSLLRLVAWLEPSPPGLQTTAPLPALRRLLNPAEASGGVTTRNSDALLELCVAHSARYFSLVFLATPSPAFCFLSSVAEQRSNVSRRLSLLCLPFLSIRASSTITQQSVGIAFRPLPTDRLFWPTATD
jgi:hypothetical protein